MFIFLRLGLGSTTSKPIFELLVIELAQPLISLLQDDKHDEDEVAKPGNVHYPLYIISDFKGFFRKFSICLSLGDEVGNN